MHRIKMEEQYCAEKEFHSKCYIDENNIIRSSLKLEIEGEQEDSLYKFFEKRLKQYGDKVALVDTDTGLQCTYNDIMTSATRIAGFLHSKGVSDGDVLAMNVGNCYNYFHPLFAAMKQNVAIATYNEYATSFEANSMLKDTNAKILFTNASQLEKTMEAIKSTNVQILVSFDKTDEPSVYLLEDILNSAEYDVEVAPENPKSELAFIYFSSGSTGKPKAAAVTKANVIAQMNQLEHAIALKQQKIMVSTIFAHVSVILVGYFAIYDNSVIYNVNEGMHKMEKCLKAIQKYKLTYSLALSPYCTFLANNPIVDEYDLSSMMGMVFGGSTVATNTVEVMKKKFPNCLLLQAFGMSETTGVAIIQPYDVSLQKTGSTGLVLPGLECKIVNRDTLKSEGANTTGEIYLRGPNIIQGYLSNPKATSENITDDGWLKTGDIAYFDDNYNFYIVDRVKEIIKLDDGVPLYPGQVEAVLLTHPDVLECCVVGKNMGTYEIPVGFVVPNNCNLDAQQLHDIIKEKLSAYKALTGGILFLEKLPKLPNGKLDRNQLKKLLKAEN